MVVRFRALACPVDASTGDQRRFADDSLEAADCPMPGRYVSMDVGGHDQAVSVAAIDSVDMSMAGEIWLEGHLLDADREATPRLAENVAEATKMIEEGIVGFSVDLDDFEAVPVLKGTDTPASMDDFMDDDAEMELLITRGRIRSATLVAIPAFVETNHTITLTYEDATAEGAETPVEADAALIASMGAKLIPFAAFSPPVPITGPTPMTYDFAATPPRAYGHIATWGTCHEGFKDSCILAPHDPSDYHDFHIHRTETDKGPVYAGRITAGGRHPAEVGLGAHAMRQHHDDMIEAARVLASEDEWGIFVCGPIADDLDDATMEILSRRKVSGGWEETASGLALIEVLALKKGPRAVSEPGFPVFAFSHGRQVALTAALGPQADDPSHVPDYTEIFRTAYAVIEEEKTRRADAARLREELTATLAGDAEMMRDELSRALEA
jgi:hypothetical protein